MGCSVETLVLGPIETNTYIVGNESGCMVVDPGGSPERIIKALGDRVPELILLTHCHWDHQLGLQGLLDRYDVPVVIYELDAAAACDPMQNGGMKWAHRTSVPAVDRTLSNGEVLEVGDLCFTVLHTPGHTPGSACFYNAADKVLISGDTLFYGAVGRTDFPTGSHRDMVHSIREVLAKLPDDVDVYPGHDRKTTIGTEKRINPLMS